MNLLFGDDPRLQDEFLYFCVNRRFQKLTKSADPQVVLLSFWGCHHLQRLAQALCFLRCTSRILPPATNQPHCSSNPVGQPAHYLFYFCSTVRAFDYRELLQQLAETWNAR